MNGGNIVSDVLHYSGLLTGMLSSAYTIVQVIFILLLMNGNNIFRKFFNTRGMTGMSSSATVILFEIVLLLFSQ